MDEENKCPQCGKVCKTAQALKAHIQWKHSGEPVPPTKGAREVPIVEEDFTTAELVRGKHMDIMMKASYVLTTSQL